MLPIIWLGPAVDDLRIIIRFIAKRDRSAAKRMKAIIENAVLTLPKHPMLFRAGREAGTREMVVHPNYIIVYRPKPDGIEIVSVLHARQEYP